MEAAIHRRTTMLPVIFHIDMDAFFVSVEELFDPSLRGKAVVVGGEPDQRGVVSAASYEARKFGVHSAMPLVTAKRLCPHAIFLPGRRSEYVRCSEQIHKLLRDYTPVVKMVSIDEAYLDFTGAERLHGNPLQLAHRLRICIEEETGLSASIGISRTKLVSKVASDLAKPRGILWVFPGQEASFLAPLKIGKLPGIGKVTERRLNDLGIAFVGDLARAGRNFLGETLGHWGESLYHKSIGLDTAHFEFRDEPKSISHEHTFEQDTSDPEIIQKTLSQLAQKVARRLRDHNMMAGTVALKLRDSNFQTAIRAVSLQEPTQLDCEILQRLMALLRKHWSGRAKTRLIGVALSGLVYGPCQQDLFDKERRDRMAKLYQAADRVRDKFGFASLLSARTIK
jgi:DNA polymerase-4